MAEKELLSVSSKDLSKKEVRYTVEEIENGFVLTQSTEWYNKKGQWQSKQVKKFYKENPLDESAIKFDADVAKAAIDEKD